MDSIDADCVAGTTVKGRAGQSADLARQEYVLGISHRQAENFDLARHCFQQAIALDPSHARARSELAWIMHMDGQIRPAMAQLAQAIELAPHDQELAIQLATFLESDRQTGRAIEILERFLQSGSKSAKLAILHARLAPAMKAEFAALDSIQQVLEQNRPENQREASSLHFAAANLLDRLGQYDRAFAEFEQANSLRGVSYDPGQVERPIREWIEYFNRPTMRRLPHATHGSELPIFIVGMPRSGTTLIEQILSSHPAVHGAGELRWMYQICQSLARRCPGGTLALSDSIDRMSVSDADALAEEYLQPLQALNAKATRIINKLPTNFMHLGMIRLLFPQARVIYCQRNALDTCLSCYMTDFAGGHSFSFSLTSLAHYYHHHEMMMEHWKSVLDLSILDVQYEEVVDDLRGQTRRLLEYLDLPWHEGCLRFYENRRFVATASNEQVRHPIYRTSVGRWKNYERHLLPLKNSLKINRV